MPPERLQRNHASLSMHTRLGKTGVWHVPTVLRFGSRPCERRFNSVSRVLSRPLQALVSSLGADVPHAPFCPQKKTMPRTNNDSWLSCTTPPPSTRRFTRRSSGDSISFLCLRVEVLFPSYDRRQSLSGGRFHHRSSCRTIIAEFVVGSRLYYRRLPALPHIAHRKISRLLHLFLISSCLSCCLVVLWSTLIFVHLNPPLRDQFFSLTVHFGAHPATNFTNKKKERSIRPKGKQTRTIQQC